MEVHPPDWKMTEHGGYKEGIGGQREPFTQPRQQVAFSPSLSLSLSVCVCVCVCVCTHSWAVFLHHHVTH
ncbi:rCG43930 [Rattus norvegicus]|uniref:RCG43930 n=1 Tax=Rattus norvegicus TaxID=10116 RepID=A6J7K4_RAT|nr:rCG43930 [Rattus norvegicus]